jgi:iron complex outermembrane receptor protein
MNAPAPRAVLELLKPITWFPPMWAFGCGAVSSGMPASGQWLTVVAGIKNLLNQDPPFSISYDTNTGAGSSWDPRIADPRGRSFTLSVEYKFF